MVLNALVDSRLSHSEKSVGLKGLNKTETDSLQEWWWQRYTQSLNAEHLPTKWKCCRSWSLQGHYTYHSFHLATQLVLSHNALFSCAFISSKFKAMTDKEHCQYLSVCNMDSRSGGGIRRINDGRNNSDPELDWTWPNIRHTQSYCDLSQYLRFLVAVVKFYM